MRLHAMRFEIIGDAEPGNVRIAELMKSAA
jgi:hypothetical protein